MIRGLFAILVILVALSACVFETGESREVKGTVMRYNQLLVEGYRNLNMNPLQEVASRERAEKAYLHMAALGEAGVRMESELKKIDFQKLEFPKPEEAVVISREVWDFSHKDIKTGAIKFDKKDFVYHNRYELRRDGNRWIIHTINTVDGEEPSGFAGVRRK